MSEQLAPRAQPIALLSRKGLFLNDDGLRHVVRSAGLTGNLVSNEGFRLAVAWKRLALYCRKLVEQSFYCLPIVPIHHNPPRY
jgi:hypothetical protein